jgi:hypothetical protein
MSVFEIISIVLLGVILMLVIWLITEYSGMKATLLEKAGINDETVKIRLQAYERLSLLTERIALHNLISRFTNAGISAREMKNTLIDAIKEEYDYNISQQVYVSPDAWRAVHNLKEQNIYIINQLAASLPNQATGLDLSKHIIDFLMNNQKGNLNSVVAEVLSFEAKKIM